MDILERILPIKERKRYGMSALAKQMCIYLEDKEE